MNKLSRRSAYNEQFATSGGATRPNGSAKQHLLALVRAFAIPPPAASCRTLWASLRTVRCENNRQTLTDKQFGGSSNSAEKFVGF